jgi:hypothetical protein
VETDPRHTTLPYRYCYDFPNGMENLIKN